MFVQGNEPFSIYDKLGGRKMVIEIIARRCGKPPSLGSMRMWKHKGRIPGNVCQVLQAECQERGIAYSVPLDFVRKEGE